MIHIVQEVISKIDSDRFFPNVQECLCEKCSINPIEYIAFFKKNIQKVIFPNILEQFDKKIFCQISQTLFDFFLKAIYSQIRDIS